MKQVIRILYILCIISICIQAQDKRPLAFKQIDLWSRIKQRFFPIKQPSIPFFSKNFTKDLNVFNNKLFPTGWNFADQETQNYVAELIKDPSITVIESKEEENIASWKSRYSGNKYILLTPLTTQILKNKPNNNKLLSWKEFNIINEYDNLRSLAFPTKGQSSFITNKMRYLIHSLIRGELNKTVHPWEINAAILHEYAHLLNDDNKKTGEAKYKLLLSKITEEEYNKEMQRQENEADAYALKSNDIHILMGLESIMLKAHLVKKIHGIKSPRHPYPLLRAWQAEDKIKEKLGPYGEE